ncbi:MAG: tetratricopeptide repeat protein [Fibrobacterota bacterium]|nr:tetratricopeptide repeat protein [Fibrobacterota bacterium]
MLKSMFGRDGILPFVLVFSLIGIWLMNLETRVDSQAERSTRIRIRASGLSDSLLDERTIAPDLAKLLREGDSLEKKGEGLRAARLFQERAASVPDSMKGYLLFKAGQMLMAMDEDSLATQAFRKSMNAPGGSEDAAVMLEITRKDGDTSLVHREALIGKLLIRHPDFAPGYFRLGLVRHKRKLLPQALEAYDRALDIFPAYKEARWNKALILAVQGRNDEALAQFQRLASMYPSRPEYHFNVGRFQKKSNRPDLAVKAYHKAISVKGGDYPEAYFNLALLYQDQDREDSAQAYLLKAISLRESYPEAWFNKGLLAMRRGDFEAAAADFGRASRQEKGYREAHFNRGLCFVKLGTPDSAVAEYRAAVGADPGYAKARAAWAVKLGQMGRYAEAADVYRSGLQLNGKNVEFWFGLGQSLRKLDSLPQAIAAYRKAVEMDPEDDKALNNLGLTLAGMGDRPQAMGVFSQGVERFPENVGIRFNLALQHAKLGDTLGAFRELRMSLRLDSSHAGSNRLQGDLFMAQGMTGKALEPYSRAVRSDPVPKSFSALARAHEVSGREMEAVAVLKQGLIAHPEDSTLLREWVRLRPGEGPYPEVQRIDPRNLKVKSALRKLEKP